jgi:hypothetical protein
MVARREHMVNKSDKIGNTVEDEFNKLKLRNSCYDNENV